jgi:tetratricopeptide (TPR) repeat protein
MFHRAFLLCCILFGSVAADAGGPIDLDRELILVTPTGTAAEDREIARWQRQAAEPHARCADLERLGWAYVAKARRTLDAGYYKLAEKTVDVMDRQFGPSPDAALLRGHVYHNLHRFGEAEAIAAQLARERGAPDDFALLSDALMEQGKLDEAVAALQRMADLRPGAEADSRIAHLRWLKGDLRGAIAAMQRAIRQTSPDDRTALAWMYVRLSAYELQAGHTATADALAAIALQKVPEYAPALLAQARARIAAWKPESARRLAERAAELNPLPEYQWWYAEACRAMGDAKRAATVEAGLRRTGTAADPRTYSLFLATKREQSNDAVSLARAELGVRADVFTHDALGWALFAHGDTTAAAAEMKQALAAGMQDARLLLHGAVVFSAAGQQAIARRLATRCQSAAATLLPSERTLLGRQVAALAAEQTAQRRAAVRANAPAAADRGAVCAELLPP